MTLDSWFFERLSGISPNAETHAYVVNVLARMRPESDMSKDSIVIEFERARLGGGGLVAYQRIGDWTLWVDVFCPEHVEPHRDVFMTLGRLSYGSCHRLLRGRWGLYEELADSLPEIIERVRCKLSPTVLGSQDGTLVGHQLHGRQHRH